MTDAHPLLVDDVDAGRVLLDQRGQTVEHPPRMRTTSSVSDDRRNASTITRATSRLSGAIVDAGRTDTGESSVGSPHSNPARLAVIAAVGRKELQRSRDKLVDRVVSVAQW